MPCRLLQKTLTRAASGTGVVLAADRRRQRRDVDNGHDGVENRRYTVFNTYR